MTSRPAVPTTEGTSVSRFRTIFPDTAKPLIAMAHVPALPGTPLYDPAAGLEGAVEAVRRDVEILVDAGFDAVLFCNENDRPYELDAGPESSAFMTRIAVECRPEGIPFGIDFLWDAKIALAAAVASGASFMREVTTGVWESDMGLWNTNAAHTLRERRRLDGDGLAVLMNITPEFASPIGRRPPAVVAKSTVVSSLADAILVSGPMAGMGPDLALVGEVRDAVPDEVPVLLNTGAHVDTIQDFLSVADGCIVGSHLKVDGHTWSPVDRERARRFVDRARTAAAA
jgi:membrane complex biogenesis BtpA family protein